MLIKSKAKKAKIGEKAFDMKTNLGWLRNLFVLLLKDNNFRILSILVAISIFAMQKSKVSL